jgi:hypothetical protein
MNGVRTNVTMSYMKLKGPRSFRPRDLNKVNRGTRSYIRVCINAVAMLCGSYIYDMIFITQFLNSTIYSLTISQSVPPPQRFTNSGCPPVPWYLIQNTVVSKFVNLLFGISPFRDHFNTNVSTSHEWLRRGFRVSFHQRTKEITRSSVKLCHLTEVACFRTLWNATLLCSLYVFYKVKQYSVKHSQLFMYYFLSFTLLHRQHVSAFNSPSSGLQVDGCY